MIEYIQFLLWMIIIPFDKDDEYGIRIHFYDLFLTDLLLSGCKQFAVHSSEDIACKSFLPVDTDIRSHKFDDENAGMFPCKSCLPGGAGDFIFHFFGKAFRFFFPVKYFPQI